MNNFNIKWIVFALLFLSTTIFGQNKTYTTKKINPHPPKIDGIFDDEAWEKVNWENDFTQYQPNEGEAPSQKTSFKILYDDDNIYVGFFCFDSEPDKIVHKELKRDGELKFDDRIDLVIDTYNDRRMGYFFGTNPNGMMVDGTMQAVGSETMNTNWDGI